MTIIFAVPIAIIITLFEFFLNNKNFALFEHSRDKWNNFSKAKIVKIMDEKKFIVQNSPSVAKLLLKGSFCAQHQKVRLSTC
jgi:hypothetical protein